MPQTKTTSTTTEPTTEIASVANLNSVEITEIRTRLDYEMTEQSQQNAAIRETFNWAVEAFPYANPSDIWYHGIYRQFINNRSNKQSALQAWRAVSGAAFESFVRQYYSYRLPDYLSLVPINDPDVTALFDRLGGTEHTATDIADIAIVGEFNDEERVFGGINCLTSFKGRLGKYTDGAEILQDHGLFAPVISLDVYTNDASIDNHGELSTEHSRRKPARLVEEDQAFSNVYSFNSRTDETNPMTPKHAVKSITSPSFFDVFVNDTLTFWDTHANTLRTNQMLTL